MCSLKILMIWQIIFRSRSGGRDTISYVSDNWLTNRIFDLCKYSCVKSGCPFQMYISTHMLKSIYHTNVLFWYKDSSIKPQRKIPHRDFLCLIQKDIPLISTPKLRWLESVLGSEINVNYSYFWINFIYK